MKKERQPEIVLPNLKLIDRKLLGVSYRVKANESISSLISPIHLTGKIRYRFLAIRKSSFKMRFRQEINIPSVSCVIRYEARIQSDTPIDKSLFDKPIFHENAVDMFLASGSEIFSFLSSKTYPYPIISPDSITLERKDKDSVANEDVDREDTSRK